MLIVKEALPLLQQSDQVCIVTCGPENKSGPKVKHLKNYLYGYNVKANHVIVKNNNDSQSIVQGYIETKSGMLVMGGYSRSRLIQQVLVGLLNIC